VTTYETIGTDYKKHRAADSRIVEEIVLLLSLDAGSTIADIAAGSGNYSIALAERNFFVKAVELSEVMHKQAPDHPNVVWFTGSAEELPLPDGSVDGVICLLAFHHFDDHVQTVKEMDRICLGGPMVVFTFDPREGDIPWIADYFPEIWDESYELFQPIAEVKQLFEKETGREVQSYPFELPYDLKDHFAGAGWRRPEIYLDESFRAGMSAFALTEPHMVDQGVRKLKTDLVSGKWDENYGWLKKQDTLDMGYHFIKVVAKD
jgi:ubiquinone/menaquinone biosynthesis C-methylase UbiE